MTSAFLAYLAGSERVTDGTRTRDLRSHNPMLCQLSYGHQAHARFYQEKVYSKTRRSEGWSVPGPLGSSFARGDRTGR
jgi:hypothetical protein